MKKIVCCFITLLTACSREEIPDGIPILVSDYGTSYTLHIRLPDHFDAARPGGYPVFLYPDAAYLKTPVVKALKSNQLEDKVIVVGIGYKNENRRTADLSPTPTAEKGTGNAPAFASFIENQVMEYLRQRYRISEGLYFCGHSLGGLFGTYLFLEKPTLFKHYLLISPSLMWDGQAIFGIEKQNRPLNAALQGRLYVAAGSQETGGFHSTIQHLTGLLNKHYPMVTTRQEVLPNKDHSGVILPALERGLDYLFHSVETL